MRPVGSDGLPMYRVGSILYGGSGADVGLYVRLYVRLSVRVCVELDVDGTAETVWECVIMSVSVLG